MSLSENRFALFRDMLFGSTLAAGPPVMAMAGRFVQQYAEAQLLPLVEAVVERLRRRGERRQPHRALLARLRLELQSLYDVAKARAALMAQLSPLLEARGARFGALANGGLDGGPVLLLLWGELQPRLQRGDARVGQRGEILGR